MFELKGKRVVVTGGGGFLGGYIVEELTKKGVKDIVVPRSKDFDLREKDACRKAVKGADLVIHAAANVGGIVFMKEHPAETFFDNAVMGLHMIHEAKEAGVKKIVLIGTACSYPENAPMPFCESDLWKGYPAGATAPYGIAKLMLLEQAQTYHAQFGLNFAYLIPVNLYGPGDSFDPEHGQVVPALIRRMIEAKEKKAPTFSVWGTGKATREFLYVRDAAEGIVAAAETYDGSDPVNLGTGIETPVKKLVELLQEIIGYKGEIIWDMTKPDGQMRRVMDISRAKKEFGFTAMTKLESGLRETVQWYLAHR